MGLLHRQGEREKERREMYLHLLVILLISPAFGKPSFVRRDVGANIKNQLDNLVDFSHETRNLLKDPKLLEKVSKSLEDAENNILEMEAHLKNLQSKIPGLSSVDNYFPKYNEAKSYLRQTRQELRELAHRTKAEVKNMNILLDDLDNSKHPILLKAAIDRMKILMKETKERLEDAKRKYGSANVAFDNLVSSLKVQNEITADFLEKTEEEFLKEKEYTEKVRYNCKWAAVVTLGLCSLIHHFVNEVPLKESHVELIALRAETDRFLNGATILSADVDAAIEVITAEIELISEWAVSAEVVRENIEEYPAEYLDKYGAIRKIFISGLDDLKNVADEFLNETEILFKPSVA